MATTDVSRRYAEALADVTASMSSEERTNVRNQLRAVKQAVAESFDLANLLHNPSISSEDRLRVLSTVADHLGLGDITSRFVRLLAERGRMGHFDEIVAAYEKLDDERSGLLRARVTSATELGPEAVERLTHALRKRTGHDLEVEVEVDPSLIGGLRCQVGTLVFDGSLRSELDRLRDRLQA